MAVASLLILRRGGDVVAQCDALCYDAKLPECVCRACGGENHGVGFERAVANTRSLHASWTEWALAEEPDLTVELDESVQHLPLF